jgi:hypothetical protein
MPTSETYSAFTARALLADPMQAGKSRDLNAAIQQLTQALRNDRWLGEKITAPNAVLHHSVAGKASARLSAKTPMRCALACAHYVAALPAA